MKGRILEKGIVSNLTSFTILVIGLGLTRAAAQPGAVAPALETAAPWLLAAGVFGFAGGITNWLAVKMLFDRVPLLYGSGVIPNRFEDIRETIKKLIMTHFFEEEYLRRFFEEAGAELFPGANLKVHVDELLQSDEADRVIEQQIEKLKEGAFGVMIRMAGTNLVKLLVKDFLGGLNEELMPRVQESIAGRFDPAAVRLQVDALLERKLQELTPETVKEMMERVMREHLGWLIVWGNVFGGAIGLASRAAASHWGLAGVP